MDTKGTLKYVGIAALIIVLVFSLAGLNWSSQEAHAENAVRTSVENCLNITTQAFNTIVEVNSLNQSQRDFLYKTFTDMMAGNQGSATQLAVFLSALNGTDLNATTLQIQQVVEAKRMEIAACQGNIQVSQLHVENLITGPFGSMFAALNRRPLELPLSAPARPLIDLDNDGKITVLDYPAVSAQSVINMQQTGIDNGPLNLNATPTSKP